MTTGTTNRSYQKPSVGGDSGAWGGYLNAIFDLIDTNLSGLFTKALSSSNYTLIGTDYANLTHRYTGTLSANITLNYPNVGAFYIVDNQTSGAFTISVSTGVGTPLVCPQGQLTLVVTDATNGPRSVGQSTFPYLPLAGGTLTGAVLHPRGSAGAPSISFTGDTNNGIFSPGADTVAVATNGLEWLRVTSSGGLLIGTTTAGGNVTIANGLNVGWLNGSGTYAVGASGASILKFSDNHFYFDNWDSGDSIFRGNSSVVLAQIKANGTFQFNSGYGSSATAYGCRAWVNFAGATGSINASGNVSSVTRNGTGDYTVTFTNAMPDANYTVTATAQGSGLSSANSGCTVDILSGTAPTTTTVRLWCKVGGSVHDATLINVMVTR